MLDFALAAHGISNCPDLATLLLGAYRGNASRPGDPDRHSLQRHHEILKAAAESGGLANLGMPLLSVEPLGIYKPDTRV